MNYVLLGLAPIAPRPQINTTEDRAQSKSRSTPTALTINSVKCNRICHDSSETDMAGMAKSSEVVAPLASLTGRA
jgi:hypothetical protein